MDPHCIRRTESGYDKLNAVANVLTTFSKNNATYVVRDVYFDLGLDWMWTTICREGYRDCQILSPRQWEGILLSNSAEELFECVKDIQEGEYFND